MAKRVTIKDVAREAGVSIALVSLVLHARLDAEGNPVCSVRRETARRIFDAVQKLGYIPNRAAAAIRSGRSYSIAVITSDISNSFFSRICRHVENLAYDQGYNVIFASSDENPTKFTQVLDSTLRLGVDGMIIVPPPHSEVAIGKISAMNIPIVLLERDIEGVEAAGRVRLDNASADRLAVEEFVRGGYRRIELVAYNMDVSTIRSRIEGYRRAMEGMGLGDRAKIHYLEYGADVDAMARLLRNAADRGCEAVYLTTNTISLLALQALKRLRMNVPGDMAVLGFDESPAFSIAEPSVSHIVQPVRALGEESFSMLVEMIEDKDAARTVVLPPELVRGGSSAPSGQ